MLKRISSGIARGASALNLEGDYSQGSQENPQRYRWEVYLLNTEEVNAFSLGAGILVVTRGILIEAENEAQFASIIAHEAAHQLLGHTRSALADIQQGPPSSSPQSHFTLEQELQADSLGLKLLEFSGYDISEARFALTIDYRQKSKKVSLPPDWLIARMASLQQQIELPRRTLAITRNTREYSRLRSSLTPRRRSPIFRKH